VEFIGFNIGNPMILLMLRILLMFVLMLITIIVQ